MTQDVESGTSLETVIIFTERMEELAEFYQSALSLGPWEQSPSHLGQQVGPVYFGFDQVDDAGQGSGKYPSWP